MHGDTTEGYEVMPINIASTAKGMRLTYDEWDYTQPAPQAEAYKKAPAYPNIATRWIQIYKRSRESPTPPVPHHTLHAPSAHAPATFHPA